MIALLVFGPKRLPELGRQVGRGIRELKTQVSAITEDVTAAVDRDVDRDDAAPSPGAPVASAPGASRAAVAAEDDDVLDGVVVSGATGPPPQPPAAA